MQAYKFRIPMVLFLSACTSALFALQMDSAKPTDIPETLVMESPSWQRILGGTVVSQPQQASYGFIQMLDGRMITACTNDGRILWQQALNGKPGTAMTVDRANDFCYALVGNNQKLQLYNPSGIWLWTAQLPSPAAAPPFIGRDGRVFIQSSRAVYCYGINGKLKWQLDTEESAGLPLYELPDGSIVYMQKKTAEGSSTAIRISPFGTVMEELVFSGKVVTAGQSPQGIILIFSDGSIGCGSAENGASSSLWFKKGLIPNPAASAVIVSDEAISVIYGSKGQSQALVLDNKTGEITGSVQGLGIDAGRLEYSASIAGEAILSDGQTAAAFNTKTCKIEWQAKLPAHSGWKYMIAAEPGRLVLTAVSSWKISGYWIKQYPGIKTDMRTKNMNIRKTYTPFISNQKEASAKPLHIPLTQTEIKRIQAELKKGNYGQNELSYYISIDNEVSRLKQKYMKTYSADIQEPAETSFGVNVSGAQQLINTLPLFAGDRYADDIAYIIRNETDPALLLSAINAAAAAAYDPNGSMLSAMEAKLQNQAVYSNSVIAGAICGGIYQICRFMGKPAFMDKGKEMLFFLLNHPRSDTRIKTAAKISLDKIIALKIQ